MSYVSRHRERDERLPQYRDELLRAALSDLTGDGGVVAVYLGGSLAKGNFDLYSDIDLRIVVPSDKIAEYVREKQNRPRRWGNVLYYEDNGPDAPATVAHYDGFVKVDMFYCMPEQLTPSVWLRDIWIVHDPYGVVGRVWEESRRLTYRPSAPDVERWRGKLFAYMHEVYRRTMRGEQSYALRMLDMVRWSIAAGWAMEAGTMPNSPGDWSKMEGDRTALCPWQLSLLDAWHAGRDPADIMNTLRSMIPELRRVHDAVCRVAGADVREERLNRVIELVV